MNTFVKTSWAWALLCIALGAWTAVILGALYIDVLVTAQETTVRAAAEQQTKDVAALRARALIAETAAGRERLTTLVKVDVVEAAKQIESAGVPAGVKFHVRDAALETASAKSATPLQSVGFSVEAEGTFVQLIQALALLRSLPFPMQLTQLDLSVTPRDVTKPSTGAPLWHATARLRLLTTAPLPS